jgi:hypothetical protein
VAAVAAAAAAAAAALVAAGSRWSPIRIAAVMLARWGKVVWGVACDDGGGDGAHLLPFKGLLWQRHELVPAYTGG